jgi:hypothetical protein
MSLTIDQTAATCAAKLAASASPRLASSRSMASASRFSADSSFEHIVEDYQLGGVRAHPSVILMSTAKRASAVGNGCGFRPAKSLPTFSFAQPVDHVPAA